MVHKRAIWSLLACLICYVGTAQAAGPIQVIKRNRMHLRRLNRKSNVFRFEGKNSRF